MQAVFAMIPVVVGIVFFINLIASIALFILGAYFGYINLIKTPNITHGNELPKNASEGDLHFHIKE